MRNESSIQWRVTCWHHREREGEREQYVKNSGHREQESEESDERERATMGKEREQGERLVGH